MHLLDWTLLVLIAAAAITAIPALAKKGQIRQRLLRRLLALQKALFVKSDKLWNRSSGFVPCDHRI